MEARPVPGNRKKEHVRKVLFENAMQGKWKAVVNMYRRWPSLGKEKINRGGNTALHMAVSDRQERFVEQLVEVILLRSGMPEVVLQIKNKQGNTPLHLAASLGNVSMCKCIPSRRPGLVGVLNDEGETPLFLAARHGLSYIHKIKKKKETNIWSIKVMDQLLNLEGTQICDYDRAGWNPLYCQRTMANYNTDSEEENKPEQDEETGLPNYDDLSATDAGVLGKNHGKQGKGDEGIPTKEGSSQKERDEGTFEENQKRNRSSEEDSNWALLLRLGKAGLRADPIIVAGKAAKKLDDELCMETEEKNDEMGRVETPILLAAKNGITEMVKEILEIYPLAIHDTDLEEKNVVLLAVENRHHHVYELLLKTNILKDTVFGAVDRNGNSVLHLAAMVPDNRPWLIPGAALQMQWEVLYVKRSMPPHFFPSHNKFNETAKQIFTRDHKDMVQKGKEWLGSTATSCSVVATLIATVGFATSSAVPGGTREGSGKPNLEQQPAFHIFAEHERKSFIISNSNTSMKRNEMNFLFSFWFHYSKYAKRK
uniref:PGG domain-containing protein n=1 Tax=Vitis vinifera TaxID=29760 RepID=F6HZN5_VITVI